MSRILNYIKRHPMRIAASVASLYAMETFRQYCATDHFEGQNVIQGVSQTLYWVIREQLGLVSSTNIPFVPGDITKEKVEACLQKSGAISADTKIKSIDVKRIGAGEGVISMVFLCSIVYENAGNSNPPSKIVIKLLPEGIKVRILLRITGQPSNEAGFYNSNMAAETGLPIPKPYFIGYIRMLNLLSAHSMHTSRLNILTCSYMASCLCIDCYIAAGRQNFCLMMEDMSHCVGGNGNELSGLSLNHAKSALRMIAKFHAKYFNCVRKSGHEFIGRSFDSARFDLLDGVCRANLPSYLKLLEGWESDGYLRKGTVTKEVTAFLEHYVHNLIFDRMKTAKPKELGGGFNTTIVHGDFRGGNLFINPQNDDVIFYDFQNLHESTIGDELAWFVSSIDEDMFRKNAKSILRSYYDTFVSQENVDQTVYTWKRFLAEMSYGGSQYITYMLASAKDLIENIDDPEVKANADKLFSIREQRAIAFRQMFNTEKMIKLCISSCPNFPSVSEYSKLLPQSLL